jgi:hypothetical protein
MDSNATHRSRRLVAAVPLPLLASGLVDEMFDAHGEPAVWISALIASAAIGTALGGAVLAGFRQRITGSGIAVLRRKPALCWRDFLPHRWPTYCASSPGVRHVPLFPYSFPTVLNESSGSLPEQSEFLCRLFVADIRRFRRSGFGHRLGGGTSPLTPRLNRPLTPWQDSPPSVNTAPLLASQ